MEMAKMLFKAGGICIAVGLVIPLAFIMSILCFVLGFILLFYQGIVEIKNKNNAPKKNYTEEARRACENVTKKQEQDNAMPWEK